MRQSPFAWLMLAQTVLLLSGCGGRAGAREAPTNDAVEAGSGAGAEAAQPSAGTGGGAGVGGGAGAEAGGAAGRTGGEPGGGAAGRAAAAGASTGGAENGGSAGEETAGASAGGAAGTAAGGAENGGSAGEETAGASAGGAAGMGGMATSCPTGVLFAPTPKLGTRETFSGTNGVFSDTCEGGDLVQYGCGVRYTMGPPGDPGPFPLGTGEVVPTNVDCEGRCVDGACPNVCPAVDTTLRFVSVDAEGNAVLEHTETGWSYACEFYGQTAGFDCAASIEAGDVLSVAQASSESLCVALVHFTVRFDADNSCAYTRCVATPP